MALRCSPGMRSHVTALFPLAGFKAALCVCASLIFGALRKSTAESLYDSVVQEMKCGRTSCVTHPEASGALNV